MNHRAVGARRPPPIAFAHTSAMLWTNIDPVTVLPSISLPSWLMGFTPGVLISETEPWIVFASQKAPFA